MKRGGAIMVLVGIVVAFFYFGGSAEGPENVPAPETPSADEAASGLQRFFDNIADAVSGWNEGTWRIVAVLALVGLGVWVFKKVPMFVWLVLALLGVVIAVQL